MEKSCRDCIVMAGGSTSAFIEKSVSAKPLLKINGRELISFVLQKLVEFDRIRRIIVVGDPAELAFLKDFYPIEIVAEKGDIMEKLIAGISFLQPQKPVFVCSSDIPFITVQAMEDFLLKCQPETEDIYYPVVAKEIIEKCFSESKRTYIKTMDGIFSGGNIFLINSDKAVQFASLGRKFLSARKNPLKIAFLLGGNIVWRFIVGRITLNYVEEYVSRRFGFNGKIIVSPYPEIACDIDKEADIALARRLLR